jgi:hypothetical protein
MCVLGGVPPAWSRFDQKGDQASLFTVGEGSNWHRSCIESAPAQSFNRWSDNCVFVSSG